MSSCFSCCRPDPFTPQPNGNEDTVGAPMPQTMGRQQVLTTPASKLVNAAFPPKVQTNLNNVQVPAEVATPASKLVNAAFPPKVQTNLNNVQVPAEVATPLGGGLKVSPIKGSPTVNNSPAANGRPDETPADGGSPDSDKSRVSTGTVATSLSDSTKSSHLSAELSKRILDGNYGDEDNVVNKEAHFKVLGERILDGNYGDEDNVVNKEADFIVLGGIMADEGIAEDDDSKDDDEKETPAPDEWEPLGKRCGLVIVRIHANYNKKIFQGRKGLMMSPDAAKKIQQELGKGWNKSLRGVFFDEVADTKECVRPYIFNRKSLQVRTIDTNKLEPEPE
jgi:hypothetical protein